MKKKDNDPLLDQDAERALGELPQITMEDGLKRRTGLPEENSAMSGLVKQLRTHVTGADDAILDEAADRVEELEVALDNLIALADRQVARIEALEAALREIAGDQSGWRAQLISIARAALVGKLP
jgi:hypothetical protein